MKIQSILNINLNKPTKLNSQSSFKTKPLAFDSTSFGARTIGDREIFEIKKEAQGILDESVSIMSTSSEVKDEAQEVFKTAKEEQQKANEYLEYAKKYFNYGGVQLENGELLTFSIEIINGESVIQISKYQEDIESQPLKTYNFGGKIPLRIFDYETDEGFNIYDFDCGRTIINKNVNSSRDTLCSEWLCTYDKGKLIQAQKNITPFAPLVTFDEFYYFVDDKLATYSKDNSFSENASVNCEQRYIFRNNGTLGNYFSNYHTVQNGNLVWDESYHFSNSKLVAKLDDIKQNSKTQQGIASKGIYLSQEGKYVQDRAIKCHFDKMGNLTVFED